MPGEGQSVTGWLAAWQPHAAGRRPGVAKEQQIPSRPNMWPCKRTCCQWQGASRSPLRSAPPCGRHAGHTAMRRELAIHLGLLVPPGTLRARGEHDVRGLWTRRV